MEKFDIYSDIAVRCGGDIYVGVVGPVRTGKSTFITRFMNELVLPKMTDVHRKQRTIDEMPQSAEGRTIMTSQPKFLPDEAVKVQFDQNVEANLRMIDCVGYLVDGAMGHMENDKPRLVNTPWSEGSMPFEKAAEFGTQKVISEHSTIGIIVTTDGSITEIARGNYVKAEERVVSELKALGKPFVVVLNSKNPNDAECEKLRVSLEEKYAVPVVAIDVYNMKEQQITDILEKVLYEFPLKKLCINLPKWMCALGKENGIINSILDSVRKDSININKMRDFNCLSTMCGSVEDVKKVDVCKVSLGDGKICVDINTDSSLYYKVISNECGVEIGDDFQLISYIKQLKEAKIAYDKLKDALHSVESTGYGVVVPTSKDMQLSAPEIVKQGGKFGVKMRATAPSLHIIQVDVETEIAPIVGTEQQSEELLNYLKSQFENDPNGIWETNMFGKSLQMMVSDGINGKIATMPDDAKGKMRKTVGRIINEGKGGVICILL